jgi:heme/copper-type cytochrome/quinol oxidase subunit 2
MPLTRRRLGLLLFGVGACVLARPRPVFVAAQDEAPGRREFSLTAKDYRWSPDRLEVNQNDLVRLAITSEDIAYSFAIDEYRIVRRVPAGGTTRFEFQADRAGTFRFYSNLTNDRAHAAMQGQFVVTPR